MDDIFANKPVDQLENADSEVKKYVILLEKKLKNNIAMNNLNKDMQTKLLNTQEELRSLKLQRKGNEQNDEAINQLKVEKTVLEIENRQLKQTILVLQNEVQHLKVYAGIIMAPAAAAAIPAASTNQATPKQKPCNNNIPDNDPDANSVLVKGFAERQLNRVPTRNIINLGRLMGLKLNDTDVVKVTQMERKYYERHNLKPNKVILIVQFRTPEIKVDFLKNKEKLKNTNLEEIEIIDYVSDEVYNLYQYAKILKTFGYAQIYWRNNCVYAKRTRSTLCDPILIKTKNDVDSLKVLKK